MSTNFFVRKTKDFTVKVKETWKGLNPTGILAFLFMIDSILSLWKLEYDVGKTLVMIVVICLVLLLLFFWLDDPENEKRNRYKVYLLIAMMPIAIAILYKYKMLSDDGVMYLTKLFMNIWTGSLVPVSMAVLHENFKTHKKALTWLDVFAILAVPSLLSIPLKDFCVIDRTSLIVVFTYVNMAAVAYEWFRMVKKKEKEQETASSNGANCV